MLSVNLLNKLVKKEFFFYFLNFSYPEKNILRCLTKKCILGGKGKNWILKKERNHMDQRTISPKEKKCLVFKYLPSFTDEIGLGFASLNSNLERLSGRNLIDHWVINTSYLINLLYIIKSSINDITEWN